MNKRLIWILELVLWLVAIAAISFTLIFFRSVAEQKKYSYYLFFKDIDGLMVGSPVRLMGTQIGYVQDIKIFDDKVFVSFLVRNKNVKIPELSVATVEFYGLGGSKSLEIMPLANLDSKTQNLITTKEPYRIQHFYDVQNGLARTIVTMGNSFSNLLQTNKIYKFQEQLKMSKKVKELNFYVEDKMNGQKNQQKTDNIEDNKGR